MENTNFMVIDTGETGIEFEEITETVKARQVKRTEVYNYLERNLEDHMKEIEIKSVNTTVPIVVLNLCNPSNVIWIRGAGDYQ